MPLYVVVGASHGIGLEYVRQLASRADTVVFTIVRNPEGLTHLKAVAASLKNIHIITGNVANYSTLERAAKQVAKIMDRKLDYLVHNTANMNVNTVYKGFNDYANMEELNNNFIFAYKVNSLGPVHSITAFLSLLRASSTKKIIVIGSGAGDPKAIQALNMANMVAYEMTKAAALIATMKFATKLKDEGFVVITLSPGMVDTSATAGSDSNMVVQRLAAFASSVKSDTGVQVAAQTLQASIASQLKVIDRLGLSHNSSFLSHINGEYCPPS